MSSDSSLKRKRTLSQSSETPDSRSQNTKPLIRSDKIYLDDGNIVLVAEGNAFRVHRSQLARHSEVFRDMLVVSDQPEGAEVFDGCPVVRMSDSSKDVLQLLRVLYGETTSRKFAQISSVLRLSTKYLIDHLRASAIGALAEAFPDELTQYEEAQSIRWKSWDVVKLAHEVQANILLPAAYYELCIFDASKVFSFNLPGPILERYFTGKDVISTRLPLFVYNSIVQSSGRDCPLPECALVWEELQLEAQNMLARLYYINRPQPLAHIGEFFDYDCVADACRECRETLKRDIENAKEDMWDCLPSIFNLGSWEELRKNN